MIPQTRPTDKLSEPHVTVHMDPDGAWRWLKCNTRYPGSVLEGSDHYLSRWDAEIAAGVVARCDRLTLALVGA
jgi:hypothetical protein